MLGDGLGGVEVGLVKAVMRMLTLGSRTLFHLGNDEDEDEKG